MMRGMMPLRAGQRMLKRRLSGRSNDACDPQLVLVDGCELVHRMFFGMQHAVPADKLCWVLAHKYKAHVSAIAQETGASHFGVVFDGFGARQSRDLLIERAKEQARIDLEKFHSLQRETAALFFQTMHDDLFGNEPCDSGLTSETIPRTVHKENFEGEMLVPEPVYSLASLCGQDTLVDRLNFELLQCPRHSKTDKAAHEEEETKREEELDQVLFELTSMAEQTLTELAAKTERYERVKNFPAYKSERKPVSDFEGLDDCFQVVKYILDKNGIPVLSEGGVEADDVIGTLASSAARSGAFVTIVSSDKDFWQLLGPRVSVLKKLFKRKSERGQVLSLYERRDERWFQEEHGGLEPWQFVDLQALIGDKADSIPGVARVGKRKAPQLLKEFGSLENLIQTSFKDRASFDPEACKILTPALQMSIQKHTEQALLGKALVRIDCDLALESVDDDWHSLIIRPEEEEEGVETFLEEELFVQRM